VWINTSTSEMLACVEAECDARPDFPRATAECSHENEDNDLAHQSNPSGDTLHSPVAFALSCGCDDLSIFLGEDRELPRSPAAIDQILHLRAHFPFYSERTRVRMGGAAMPIAAWRTWEKVTETSAPEKWVPASHPRVLREGVAPLWGGDGIGCDSAFALEH